MPVDCQRSTSGGKGNLGMFIERDPKICAAGLPTAQPDYRVADSLQHYLLKDEVDALMSDTILPSLKPKPLPPLRKPIPLDTRYAGPFGYVTQLVNPPTKTKFQVLVDDLKDTSYSSYWKKPLGQTHDSVPMLPEGFDAFGTTFGKKTPFHGRFYDVVMPKIPYPDKTPTSKFPGVQLERNYCAPPYNGDLTYGYRTYVDKRGSYAKCCLTDNRTIKGTAQRTIVNSIQAKFEDEKQPRIGTVLAPNDNINYVPDGHAFGKLKPPCSLSDCLTTCEINPGKHFFRKCIAHLNSLRKYLSKRFLPTFFYGFYLNLKYLDKNHTHWLPKNIVMDFCGTKMIRFDPEFIIPLLSMWEAFDGSNIKYKTFVHIINYREPLPQIPKIPDLPAECLDFRTTYTEMVKAGQKSDALFMAGLPSGRYFDLDYPITPERCSKADRICLPQESNMKSCLNPNVLTLLHVNHRDMYAKREPHTIKKVFETSGETFTEETFNELFEEAKKYHSQGWVCYETFRRVLEEKSKTREMK
uniref:Chemosensory protein n=1 Tax=Eogystia hippophaecolus TaxID=1206364 RepID=A0A1B3P5M9_EOGHI|nr:chemosensory protein [Eogystia hippophaecolus]